MPPAWRHRDSRQKRKKYYRGVDNTGTRLPVGDLLTQRLRIIQGYFEARKEHMSIERFDHQFGSTAPVERYDLRKEGLITQQGGYILLTPKAVVLLKHIRDLKS